MLGARFHSTAKGTIAPLNGSSSQLILADGLCPKIAELLPGALHDVGALGASASPLTAITEALAQRRLLGQAVDTLHVVAHGRPGAFEIGGQWVTAASLIANAELLAQWQVGTIALWSCEVGADARFAALLEELTGATVWTSSERIGRVDQNSNWQLMGGRASQAPSAPWNTETLQAWPHQLATYTFATAYRVTNVAGKEQNLHTFDPTAPLGTVQINDGTGGQKFSGNDVSASAIVIEGITYYVWVSRPIKIQGQVVGFYAWTDADFTSLAIAQADGNADADGNTGDNIGFVLVVAGKESFFASGTIGSSSDRVDTALNSLLPLPTPAPVANPDDASGTPGQPGGGGAAVESGVDIGGPIATVDATGNVLSNDDPFPGTTVTFAGTTDASSVVSGSGSTSVVGSYGTLTIFADGSYTYVVTNTNPEVDALLNNSLVDVFTYTMVDSLGRESTSTLSITVLGSNDAPVANDDFNSAKESLRTDDTAYNSNDPLGDLAIGDVLDNDTDVDAGDSKSITGLSTSGNALGSATGSADTVLNFTAGPNFGSINVGDFVFLDDGAGNFTPLVDAGGNHLTVLTKDDVNSTLTLSGTPAIPIADGTALGFNSNDLGGPSTKQATVDSVTPGNPNLIDITGLSGMVAVGMTVDGSAGLAPGSVITAINYDANGVPVSIVVSQPLTGPVSGALNFSGSDNLVAGGFTLRGIYGVLELQANGSYVYTPDANGPLNEGDIGTETFTYTMRDAAGVTDTATLTITVLGSSPQDANGVDDIAGPINEKGGVSNGSETPPTAISGLDVLSNDDNPDNGESSLLVVGISDLDAADFTAVVAGGTNFDGRYGTITIFPDGTWNYVQLDDTPELQALKPGQTLTEEFRYQVTNGLVGTNPDTASIFITIAGANDAPIADNDASTAIESGGNSFGLNPSGNVLDNDGDFDNSQAELFVTAIRTGLETDLAPSPDTPVADSTRLRGQYGWLTINPDGSWTYDVEEALAAVNDLIVGESLPDTFTYTVSDLGLLTDLAELRITIDGTENLIGINDVVVNEASSHAVFTVTGDPGVQVALSLGEGVPPALLGFDNPLGDASNALQVYVNGAWTDYNTTNFPSGYVPIQADGKLLTRVAIRNDDRPEGNEYFTLTAVTRDNNTATGNGTINDEGIGTKWTFTGNNDPGTPSSGPGPGFDDDQPPANLILRTETNSANIGDRVTSNGFAQVQMIGALGRSSELVLKGPDGTILDPINQYRVTEVALDDQPGKAVYVIDLLDADGDSTNGNQAFGRYFQGQSTGNGPSQTDGFYTIHYNGVDVGNFEIRTNALNQPQRLRCLTRIYGKAGDRGLESTLFGFRTDKQRGTNGDDNLAGTNTTSDVLTGLKGSDLLNGNGNRLAGASFDPTDSSLTQVDTLTGGKNRDFFQLGDIAGAYYTRNGSVDKAVITDFAKDDCLILEGEIGDYTHTFAGGVLSLSRGGDLVAEIRGKGASFLDSQLDNAALSPTFSSTAFTFI